MRSLQWRTVGLLLLLGVGGGLGQAAMGELRADYEGERVRFSLEELRKAERLVDRQVIEGERFMVKAPAAALELFPRLTLHFRSTNRQLLENEEARSNPSGTEGLVASYEMDIALRERFNTVLLSIRQDIGSQEDYFSQLETMLRRQEAEEARAAEALSVTREILENEIAPAARDDRVDYLDVSWPLDLPEEAHGLLEDLLDQVLESRGEERSNAWQGLTRAFRRLESSHRVTRRQIQDDIEMHRKVLAHDPIEVFRGLSHLIDLCLDENEGFNARSERAISVSLGEVEPASATAETN